MSASAFQMAAEQRQQLQFNIFGTDGYIQIDIEHEWIRKWDKSGFVMIDLGSGSQSYNCDGPPNALLDLIIGRTQENKSPLTVGLRSVELIEAAYESGRLDKSVLIPVTN
jgi:predicted dehydrogenase